MELNVRIGDLELRSCNETLTSFGEHTTFEIVLWNNHSNVNCHTVAYWNKQKDFIVVGKRLNDSNIDKHDFFMLYSLSCGLIDRINKD